MTKTALKRTSTDIFNIKIVGLHDAWTGKIQVILLSAERNSTCTLFRRSYRDAFSENEGKIHERECAEEFFL